MYLLSKPYNIPSFICSIKTIDKATFAPVITNALKHMYSKGPNSSVYTIIYFWKKIVPIQAYLVPTRLLKLTFRSMRNQFSPKNPKILCMKWPNWTKLNGVNAVFCTKMTKFQKLM